MWWWLKRGQAQAKGTMDNDEDFTPDENAHRKKIDRAAEKADHYAAMGLQGEGRRVLEEGFVGA